MQTEAARLDLVEAAAAQLLGVDRRTLIAKQNFQAIGQMGRATAYTFATYSDGLIGPSVIAMAHDVGQGFIDGAGDGATLGWREAEDLREAFKRAPNDGKQLRVTVQFEFQQKSVIRRGAYTCCITLRHKKKEPPTIRA
jgi:hypothetical protein